MAHTDWEARRASLPKRVARMCVWMTVMLLWVAFGNRLTSWLLPSHFWIALGLQLALLAVWLGYVLRDAEAWDVLYQWPRQRPERIKWLYFANGLLVGIAITLFAMLFFRPQ